MATNNALQNTFRTDFAESLMEEFSVNSDDQYFIFFGKAAHKIKKKAEQIACQQAIELIHSYY